MNCVIEDVLHGTLTSIACPTRLPHTLKTSSNINYGIAVRTTVFLEDGPVIVDRGALPGVLKRLLATCCAAAAAKNRSNYADNIIDNPWVARKISPGAAWFVALRPSSLVHLVTSTAQRVAQPFSLRSARRALCVFVFREYPTSPARRTTDRSACAKDPL
jgi:hypothetical protein